MSALREARDGEYARDAGLLYRFKGEITGASMEPDCGHKRTILIDLHISNNMVL